MSEKKPQLDLNETILDALLLIQRTCREHECSTCPFAVDADCCIQSENPSEWNLNVDKEIRYFL